MSFAFIVDGQTEKKIIQHLCPDSPIRMTNLNGKDVSVAAIAKRVSSLIKLLKGRYYPVLVLVDRENRQLSAAELESSLEDELANQYGISTDGLIISCPDRMIENWMLSDAPYLKQAFDIDAPKPAEGLHGKGIMKQLLAKRNAVYHELTIGVEIFTRLDPQQLRANSESFLRMAHRTEHSCRWLRIIR